MSAATLPPDDAARYLTLASADDDITWIFLAGDVYGLVITGAQTAGQYCLIDMSIPPGGGPPLHRHDFEELFIIEEGELEFTFRDTTVTARAGDRVNIPANAPHHFANRSAAPARMLCMCTPAGQDEYFRRVGDVLDSRDAPPPHLSDSDLAERRRRAEALAATYATEQLGG